MTSIFWIKGLRETYVPVVNNYITHKNKQKNGIIHWFCSHKHCDVNLRTVATRFKENDACHNHADDTNAICTLRLKKILNFKIWEDQKIKRLRPITSPEKNLQNHIP
ncbi:hypothetical protein DMUE_4112 [Dictyocoela muelleri]|nr:hypothetical protein DMUE_4112 [Dictyocoela muelleri]